MTRVAEADWTLALSLAVVSVPLATAAGRLARSATWRTASIVLTIGAMGMAAAVLMLVEDLFLLGDGATSSDWPPSWWRWRSPRPAPC